MVNHVKGSAPACDCMEFGEVRYGAHKTEKPLVHKITNQSNTEMFCIDAEVLAHPPIVSAIPLVADHHELVKTRDRIRVYKVTLHPGESVSVSYAFFHLVVVLIGSVIKKEVGDRGSRKVAWEETSTLGDISWHEPSLNVTQTNVGQDAYEAYICEWR